ncbi:DUF2264 domain-containing protein [Microlunatus speluncae]|uniref:DUF2264 domain-containing protein n=1 Tax=Microlunatus speluncae TaxID=2594267 RepID=UPI0012663186|nr:DUF2264 domain-containing protein [Microlunatus speluncae]
MTSQRGLDEDRELSPYTGWTRRHVADLADRSLLALRPWATPDHARFDLPGPSSGSGPISDGLEGFARSFLAAGFRLAGADVDPHDHAGWYARGLIAGTDPDSGEAWPSLAERGQARVEAAAIAIALHESRRWIWDVLPPRAQERIIDWLAGSIGAKYSFSNWRWFQNVTQAFLRSVGGPYDKDELATNLEFLDSCYLGDGWYSDGRPDGRGGNIDWYAGWVMQQFSVWYCRMSADEPGIETRLDTYRERLRDYVASAAELFGADGAPLYQGRSLVYRYAAVGALWTGAIFDANPLPPGRLRRTCVGAIRYFADRDAFDGNGLLSLGWHGRFDPMRQSYSGPGSPYWASLGLAGLALPATHTVWTEPEQPAPIDLDDTARPIRPIGWLTSGTAADGIVRVVNHGVDHSGAEPKAEAPQYNRYGYSTVTAPVPLPGGAAEALDNQVVLVDSAGRWSQRPIINLSSVDDHRVESRQLAYFARVEPAVGFDPGPELHCVSILRGAIEVRAVRLGDVPAGESAPDRLLISGFAVPRTPAPGARSTLVSTVHPLTPGGTTGSTVHPEQNAFGADLEVPWTRFDTPEPARWYAVAIGLAEAEPDWPTVDVDGSGGLVVTWADGSIDRMADAP